MSRVKLGEWRWYVGSDTDDDEMMDSGTREQALIDGRHAYGPTFYLVEARVSIADERAMAAGKRDTAPFAETRNGRFIGPCPDSARAALHPTKGGDHG